MSNNDDYAKIIHEVKNNITYINSSLQMIAKKHPEVKNFDYWNDVMQEISVLKNTMIELSSAKPDDDISLLPVEPEAFLTSIISTFQPIFAPNHFTCILHTDSILPQIKADSSRLKRAFINLIKNSFEAMGQKGSINIYMSVQESFVQFELIDFGGGLSPEYLPKIFTPFETTKADGTGLGLLIAKQIIEMHTGSLRVDSRPGDGCTFTILIPSISS